MTDDPVPDGWTLHDDPGLPVAARPLWIRDGAYGFLAQAAHANARGVVHGGMLATFMDHALGLTVREATGGVPLATIQLDLHYIAAALPGQFLELRGEVTRRTRSVVFIRGTMTTGTTIILTASGVWKILSTR